MGTCTLKSRASGSCDSKIRISLRDRIEMRLGITMIYYDLKLKITYKMMYYTVIKILNNK